MRNLDTVPSEVLVAIAAYCFDLGLSHAGRKQRITSPELLILWCARFGVSSWRVFHEKKFRQVYGAGYDIAKEAARLRG